MSSDSGELKIKISGQIKKIEQLKAARKEVGMNTPEYHRYCRKLVRAKKQLKTYINKL